MAPLLSRIAGKDLTVISNIIRKLTNIEYAVIAGGGGGAGELGGGGGAGGFRVGTLSISMGTSYPVTVGGAGSYAYSNPDGNPAVALYYYGTPGQPSSFGPITATGGGGGTGYWSTAFPGGSGGGGSQGIGGYGINPTTPAPLGGPFARTEGYPGGTGNAYGMGGGGGAGSAGGDHLSGTGPTPPSGNGGNGAPVDWPEIPASYGVSGPAPGRWFAGGGGGGGGAPGYSRAFPGSPGIAGNTYGAGGQGGGTPSSTGSTGYAGIVMLRAPINFGYSGSGYTTNASPTHRVFIFTSPGSIAFNSVPEPAYFVSPSTSSVNEGSSVTFTVNTVNVPNGTTLYWTTSAVSGSVNSSDFNDSVTSGSFTITSGSGTITRTLSNDVTSEGSESFQLEIRTGSTSGPIVATSSTVTINDTSTPAFTVTGGTKVTSGSYTYHYFYNTSSYTITGNTTGYSFDWLLVAGGGAGGNGYSNGGSGGGGAGGMKTGTVSSASPGTRSFTIGSGGTAANKYSLNSSSNGSPSSATLPDGTLVSVTGGGVGLGIAESLSSANGGSGGGGSFGAVSTYGTGVSGEGNNGGGGASAAAGGGGGKGAVGGNGVQSLNGGPGGIGAAWVDGSYYAGGGGGGARNGGQPGGSGGLGGGGAGGNGTNSGNSSGANGASGTPGTGGGGGGAGYEADQYGGQAGAGGPGIFAIRYLTP